VQNRGGAFNRVLWPCHKKARGGCRGVKRHRGINQHLPFDTSTVSHKLFCCYQQPLEVRDS
jgi:hypothetical protein